MQPLPQPYSRRLMRAINEFNMIKAGDRILIGLSGGKDSVFLTYALAYLRDVSRRPFSLGAFTLDPLFSEDFDAAPLAQFCESLRIPFDSEKADIAGIIRNTANKEPCFTCAFFRRGAVNRFALTHGYNKVALAHHHDDAVETFFMSLLYSGQLQTFLPCTYLDRTGLTVIRPLIYFREREIKRALDLHGFNPIPSPCPFNGKTKRQEIKDLIYSLGKKIPQVYDRLAAAMRESGNNELWPPAPPRDQLKRLADEFWHG